MIGQLHEHPLAELLHEISAKRLSGALRLKQERRKTAVYVVEGEVTYAASNLKQHRLAECVRRWQALAVEELPAVSGEASDFEVAEALVTKTALSRAALEVLQSRQVTEVLHTALLWVSGTWEFAARVRLTQDVRISLDVGNLLLESVRQLPSEFTASRFPDDGEKLSPELNTAPALGLLPTEAFVLSRIEAPLTLGELVTISGLPDVDTRHIVYTLVLGGLLRREHWPIAFNLELLAAERSAKVPVKEAPKTAPPAPQPSVAAPTEAAVSDPEAESALELEAHFERLGQASNYYQMLGVRTNATVGEIKGAYHKLAKRFHPDLFHKGVDAALHARVETAFAGIAQAYETLKDRQLRNTYDLKLAQQSKLAQAGSAAPRPDSGQTGTKADSHTGSQTKASPSQRAEDTFGRGMQALQQGKATIAIGFLAEAARLMPQEARYRAFHGRALSDNEGTWRQAEAELKTAISLDANNANYHVMLAEFYAKIGLPRRAQGELERALSLDAQNAAARQLLGQLQSAKGK